MEMTTLIECGLERIEAQARHGCAAPTPAPEGMVVNVIIAGIVLILALMRKR